MTVSNSLIASSYTGDGANKDFNINFSFVSTADILVYLNGVSTAVGWAVLRTGSQYYVHFNVAPTNGVAVKLTRSTPRSQALALTANGNFPAASAESALDKLTMMIQELTGPVASSSGLNDGTYGVVQISGVGTNISFIDGTITLPKLTSIASRTLLGNTAGPAATPTAVTIAAMGIPDTLTANTFLDTQTVSKATGGYFIGYNPTTPGVVAEVAGGLVLNALNNAGTLKTFVALEAITSNVTPAAEAGHLKISTLVAGALTDTFRFGAGLYSKNAVGGDKGIDTLNVKGLYVDGAAITLDTIAWTSIVKATDFTVTNNATLAADSELTFSVVSGQKYQVEITLYSMNSSGGSKYGVSGPTATRFALSSNISTSATSGIAFNSTWGQAQSNLDATVTISAHMIFTATANGTFAITFAQSSLFGTASVLVPGSRIRYRTFQ